MNFLTHVSRIEVPMIVGVSGPSGSGKTSLVQEILRRVPNLHYSVSCTTRRMREGEVEGRDYYFKDPVEFSKMAHAGKFAEYTDVHGNMYGTLYSELAHPSVILDIDYKGIHRLKVKVPQLCSVFILTSLPELERRLIERKEKDLALRLENAAEEIRQAERSDYWITNEDNFSAAASTLQGLIYALGTGGRLGGTACRDRRVLEEVRTTYPARM